jgi:hypothetical protein
MFHMSAFACQATLRTKSGHPEAADEAHRLVKSQSASFASVFMFHMSAFSCYIGLQIGKIRSNPYILG